MSKTTTQLADAVLRELGVADAEETPDTVDRTYVTDRYSEKFAEMAAHGLELTYWAEATIPDQIFLVLRDLMMNEVRGAFGEPMAPEDKDARETVILKRLRRHVARPASGLRTQAEYF